MARTATIHRKTNETDVTATLNIDGTGVAEIHTGIGFLDHMLHHIAVHGLFDLTVKAVGDLHVDEHHTVEDIALVLGQAFADALGDKKGIVRTAHAYVPMDETLALVVLDLSGRPYVVIDVEGETPWWAVSLPHLLSISLRVLPSPAAQIYTSVCSMDAMVTIKPKRSSRHSVVPLIHPPS